MTKHRLPMILPLLIILLSPAVGLAAELDPAALDRAERHIREAIDAGTIPGAVLLIGRSDGVAYWEAFGHRALKPQREKMTPDTVFDIASLTKPVATATSVMKLMEQGKIAPGDRVAEHLPGFGTNGKSDITVAQLLLHRSGLTPDNHVRDYDAGRAKAIENILALAPRWEPGAEFHYSDVGYILLAELVWKIDGRRVNEFAQQEIFEPIGTERATFNPPKQWREHIAPTEKRDGDWLRGSVHDPRASRMGGIAGHAGLFATAGDLARYCRMILNGGTLDGNRVLDKATVRRMTRPRYLPNGQDGRTFGFDAATGFSSPRGDRFPRHVSFGHSGFTGTMLWIDPTHDAFVVLLTNRLHVGRSSTVDLYRKVSTAAGEALLGPGPDPNRVMTGIDVLARDGFQRLEGQKVGLITNHTGRDRHGRRTLDLLHNSENVELTKLFSPEHGLFGEKDEEVGHAVEPETGLRVWSLYGETRKPTPKMLEGLDTLVFDIQDIGARFYTYISTMGNAMEAAAEHDLRVVVLDRPNPITGERVAGPLADEDKLNFVAYKPIPIMHGMTVGELARLFNNEYDIGCDLDVVKMNGWERGMWWDETGLPWINPSPNMRNPKQALLYPGVALLEYTNVNCGRGTDEPFERFGATWIDPSPESQGHRRLAAALNEADLPGLRFTPITFTPDSSEFAGEKCGGVHLIVTDREKIQPVRTGLTITRHLKRLFGDKWKHGRVLGLLKNEKAHAAWQNAEDIDTVTESWAEDLKQFREVRSDYLIYD